MGVWWTKQWTNQVKTQLLPHPQKFFLKNTNPMPDPVYHGVNPNAGSPISLPMPSSTCLKCTENFSLRHPKPPRLFENTPLSQKTRGGLKKQTTQQLLVLLQTLVLLHAGESTPFLFLHYPATRMYWYQPHSPLFTSWVGNTIWFSCKFLLVFRATVRSSIKSNHQYPTAQSIQNNRGIKTGVC